MDVKATRWLLSPESTILLIPLGSAFIHLVRRCPAGLSTKPLTMGSLSFNSRHLALPNMGIGPLALDSFTAFTMTGSMAHMAACFFKVSILGCIMGVTSAALTGVVT